MTFPFTHFKGKAVATPGVAFLSRSTTIKMLSIEGNFGYGSGWTGTNFTYTGSQPYDRGYASWRGSTPESMPAAFLSQIVAAGFDTMRVVIDPGPLNYGLRTSTATFAALMAQIQAAIALNTAAGLRTLVDLSCRPTSSVQAAGAGLTDDEVLAAAPAGAAWLTYLAMVNAVAVYLAAHNSPADVALEMFNEPPPGHAWATHAPAMWAQARAGAPGFTIFVAGDGYAAVSGLTALTAANYDGNTCFVLHFYSPYEFCFVAQNGAPSSMQYVQSLEFPPLPWRWPLRLRDATVAINADGALTSGQKTSAIAAVTSALSAYYTNGQTPAVLRDAAWITAQLNPASAWASAQGVASSRCIIGEFGANGNSIYNHAGYQGATDGYVAAFYQAILSWASAHGFNWGVFSGRDAPTFGNGLTIAPGGATPLFNNARLLALGLNPVADPNAFVVAAGGSDAAAGTLAAPFLTGDRAVTAMNASGGTRLRTYLRGTVSVGSMNLGAGQSVEGYPLDPPLSATLHATAANLGSNSIANISLKNLRFTSSVPGSMLEFIACPGLTIQDCDPVCVGFQGFLLLYLPAPGTKVQGITGSFDTWSASGAIFPLNVVINDAADRDNVTFSDMNLVGATFALQIQQQGPGGVWTRWHFDRIHATGWGSNSSGGIGNEGISLVGSLNPGNHDNTNDGCTFLQGAGVTNGSAWEWSIAGFTCSNNTSNSTWGLGIISGVGCLIEGNNITSTALALGGDGTGVQVGINTLNGVTGTGSSLSPAPSGSGLPHYTPSEPYP